MSLNIIQAIINSKHRYKSFKIRHFAILTVLVIGFFPINPARAEDFVFIRQIEYPLNENYILTSPAEEITFSAAAGSIDQNAVIKLMQLADQKSISNYFTYSENIEPASDLYYFEFVNKDGFQKTRYSIRPKITVKYKPDNQYKEIYYYRWSDLKFVKMDTIRDTINHTLTFEISEQQSLIFALFNEREIAGLASWYVHNKYKNQLIAASVDFAQDAKVKVINSDNNKEVIVTIKDYGPKKCSDWTEKEQKIMGPCQDRILDLSKTAFKVLAPTSLGIINVKVMPIE